MHSEFRFLYIPMVIDLERSKNTQIPSQVDRGQKTMKMHCAHSRPTWETHWGWGNPGWVHPTLPPSFSLTISLPSFRERKQGGGTTPPRLEGKIIRLFRESILNLSLLDSRGPLKEESISIIYLKYPTGHRSQKARFDVNKCRCYSVYVKSDQPCW